MIMRATFLIVPVFLLFFLLFGCVVSVNPTDLNPSNNYSVVKTPDQNTSLPDQNSFSGTPVVVVPNPTQFVLSASEVAKHSAVNDCWMIINGNVYDLSQYVGHPGGYTYVPYCGKDATQGYDTKGGRGRPHSSYSDYLLSSYLIGSLGQTINKTQ